jgi:hypothetical protein
MEATLRLVGYDRARATKALDGCTQHSPFQEYEIG